MELFHEDGRVKSLGQRLKECSGQYDTAIVEGVDRVADFKGYEYREMFKYSFTDVRKAYGIRQNGSDYIEWESNEIHSLDREYVILAIEMTMGNGRAYPQPTGQFDLYLSGRRIISFTVVKHSNIWVSSDARLYFEIKKKKLGGLDQNYTLDEWIRDDNLVVNGIGYLRIPTRLLNGAKREPTELLPDETEQSSRSRQKIVGWHTEEPTQQKEPQVRKIPTRGSSFASVLLHLKTNHMDQSPRGPPGPPGPPLPLRPRLSPRTSMPQTTTHFELWLPMLLRPSSHKSFASRNLLPALLE